MLREWCKLLLLIVGLGLFGFQTVAAEHHHEAGEPQRTTCVACVLHETPATQPPVLVELPLPAPPPPLPRLSVHRDVDPPPALVPADVSPSTSPPRPSRVA